MIQDMHWLVDDWLMIDEGIARGSIAMWVIFIYLFIYLFIMRQAALRAVFDTFATEQDLLGIDNDDNNVYYQALIIDTE